MTKPKDEISNIEFAGKIKSPAFKQLQLEQLIKNGIVIPAAKLVETQAMELQRVRDFELAAADEGRHRRPATDDLDIKINGLPLTREPFEDGT